MSRLYWSNLPEAKRPRGGTSTLCSSSTTEDLPMPEYPETSTNSGTPVLMMRIEAGKQRRDLTISSVQLFGDQQLVRRVLQAEREDIDAAARFPFRQAASQIALDTAGGLVTILGCLGEQFHDDRRDGRWDTL